MSRVVLSALPDPLLLVEQGGRVVALNRPGEAVLAAMGRDQAGARHQFMLAAQLAQKGISGDPVPIGLVVDGAAMCFELTARQAGADAVVLCRDVSAETSVREVLLESRQRYKHLVEIGADFVWECDEGGAFSFVSEPGAFGFSPDRLVGRQPSQFVLPGNVWPARIIAPMRDIMVTVRAADGRPVRLALNAGPISDGVNGQRGVRGVGWRLPDAAAAAHAAGPDAEPSARAARILESMRAEWRPDDMLHSCAAATWHSMAAAGCVIYGDGDGWQKLAEAGELPPDHLLTAGLEALRDNRALHRQSDPEGALLALAVHCQGRRTGVVVVWRPDAGADWQQADIDLLCGLDEPCGIAIRQALEIRRLTRLSRSDSLTGLLNRRAFLLELTAALARASRQRTTGALVYLDLDNFKRLNDLHGHDAGDEALSRVAAILGSAIRPYDLAARLGGDEFAIWLEDISGRDAGRSARRIATAIAAWSAAQTPQGSGLGASIGIAVFDPAQPESPEDLIERADRAMYRAKRADGNPVAIARPRRRGPPRGGARSA